MFDETKQLSVAEVYYALRNKLGGKAAEEIMDSLEGKPEDYAILRDIISEGKLDEYLSAN